MKTLKMKWTGIRPMLMHNGRLADPLNPFTKALKNLTKQRSKTDENYEAIARAEWEGSLYWSGELGLYVPSDNLERCLQLGAQKKKNGKKVQAAVFCTEPEVAVDYTGPTTIEGLWKDERFRLAKGVGVNGSRVIRTRPMLPTGWSVAFAVEYDESVVDEADIIDAAKEAGSLIGLGDWRPKFGRFTVEVIEVRE